MAIDISQYVAQFGRNTGAPIAAGINRGLERGNRNRMVEQQRQDVMQERNRMAQAQQQEEQRQFLREGVEALQSVPEAQQPQVYQGWYGEAQRRGYDMEGEPQQWDPEMLPRMMGAAGVSAPGEDGTGLPADLRTHNALLATLDDPNATPEQVKAARVALKLDPSPSGAGAKVVTVEGPDGRRQPFLQFADGSVQPFSSGLGGGGALDRGGQPSTGQPQPDPSPTPQQTPDQDRFITRTPEEEAAAITKARQEAIKKAELENPKAVQMRETGARLVQELLSPEMIESTKKLFGSVQGTDFARGMTFDPDVLNAKAKLEQLQDIATAENMGIMSGVLSESDLKVIGNIAGGGLVGRQSDDQAVTNLRQLGQAFGGDSPQGSTAGATGTPSVGVEEDGYIFIGGDPSSPESWVQRRQ